MSQIISAKSQIATKIGIPCPKCETRVEVPLPAFIVAINEHTDIKCADCDNDFGLMLLRLSRQPEQRNDADSGIPEALCDDVAHDFLKSMGDKFCGTCGTPLLP